LEKILTKKPESCKNCGSSSFVKRGLDISTKGKKQRFQCLNCGKVTYGDPITN